MISIRFRKSKVLDNGFIVHTKRYQQLQIGGELNIEILVLLVECQLCIVKNEMYCWQRYDAFHVNSSPYSMVHLYNSRESKSFAPERLLQLSNRMVQPSRQLLNTCSEVLAQLRYYAENFCLAKGGSLQLSLGLN